MPRGKYVNHKGRSRHFTSPEELEQERKKAELKKRQQKNKDSEDESSAEEEENEGSGDSDGSENSDDSSDEDVNTNKGVHGLIEVENPNRVYKKPVQKVTAVKLDEPGSSAKKPELSRREREEIEKQRAQANYQKLHAEGKTDQARADLARLAIIKQNRAEAAAKREAEKKEKEDRKVKAAQ